MISDPLKASIARCGFALGMTGFVLGFFMLCDCPGWYACTALIFILPIVWGPRRLRIFGLCFCVLSIAIALVQFPREKALARQRQDLKDRYQTQKP